MLFDECGCCNCGYRVQILPSGFGGAIVNSGLFAKRADLFVRSMSVELKNEAGDPLLVRPAASPTPIALEMEGGNTLALISDVDYVELEFVQSPGHVLRMTFEGTNTLLDSDDPVTLAVDEDSLDDTAWPEDPFGRDYLTRSSVSWQVRILKPASPCRCRVCYCGQESAPIDLAEAPAAYTLQFIEGFADDQSEFYGPGLPEPFSRFTLREPDASTCYDVCAPGGCVPDISRWEESFSLQKMTAEELEDAGMDPGSLAYASDPIPVNSCEAIRYLLLPCSIFGFASFGILGTGFTTLAANGTRPGWKFDDYFETPATYTTDLFENPIDFGVATLTASESHEPFVNEECPERSAEVPEEMIVEFYGESCAPNACGNDPQPADIGGSYTLTLDAENSTDCVAIWEFSEDTAFPNLGDGDLFQEQPTLRIRLECHNNIGGVECLCEGGTWYLTVQGLSPEYVSRTDAGGGNVTSRMPWFFGQTYKDGNQIPLSYTGVLPFSEDYAGDAAACRSPCEEGLSLDQPEEHIAALGQFARPGRLVTLAAGAVGVWGGLGTPYPGLDPATQQPLPGVPPANGPRVYKGYGGYKITR